MTYFLLKFDLTILSPWKFDTDFRSNLNVYNFWKWSPIPDTDPGCIKKFLAKTKGIDKLFLLSCHYLGSLYYLLFTLVSFSQIISIWPVKCFYQFFSLFLFDFNFEVWCNSQKKAWYLKIELVLIILLKKFKDFF